MRCIAYLHVQLSLNKFLLMRKLQLLHKLIAGRECFSRYQSYSSRSSYPVTLLDEACELDDEVDVDVAVELAR